LHMQPGMVIVGRRDGYLTTTVTETAAVQNVQFLETGTQLTFVPYISDDGYVRMAIQPKDSTGGLTASNLPFEQTTEVGTNIVVRDGHTILIGGLFREVSSTNRAQVPVVGNIPIAGALFRRALDNTKREEVIILLTVHLIKDVDDADKASMAALNDVERYRVGMRQGLQFTGRDRLAQAHYHWALENLAKGHRGLALWDLGLAVNNNPKLLAAIQLREKLSGQREWDEDGSAVRQFVRDQIAKETGTDPERFGRPQPMIEMPDLHGPNGFDDGAAQAPRSPESTAPLGKEETR
jgi:type IV pilus assembly protein PilQ